MLTVDVDRLAARTGGLTGKRVLDIGCGNGRHSFALARAGAHVVAADLGVEETATTHEWLAALREGGEVPEGTATLVLRADVFRLPFADGAFDVVVASEILEHLPADTDAMAEIRRVLAAHGELVVTVPTYAPELVCWALSHDYHDTPGGHVRIYRRSQLESRLARQGFRTRASYHAHALHSPYWWLKCAVGVRRDVAPVRAYHRLLVWDMTEQPWLTRAAERVLSPVIGKSLVLHLRRADG